MHSIVAIANIKVFPWVGLYIARLGTNTGR